MFPYISAFWGRSKCCLARALPQSDTLRNDPSFDQVCNFRWRKTQ